MSTLNPYISFEGGVAKAALEFYQAALGGDLNLSTFGEFGDPSAPGAEQIMHGQLVTPAGFTLMGADVPPGMPFVPGASITISLSGDDDAELRGYWDKLSAGGTVGVPLEPQVWGDTFGQFTDQFGISWMVNIAGETPA